MNALERALAKFSHDAGVLDALTQLRHQQEVRVQWRHESGALRRQRHACERTVSGNERGGVDGDQRHDYGEHRRDGRRRYLW